MDMHMTILGLHEGHCATAALMKDGKIVAAISEERLTRNKNEVGYPKKAIDACLEQAGVKSKDINLIAMSTKDFNTLWLKIKRESSFSTKDYVLEQHEYFKPLIIDKKPIQELAWSYIKTIEKRKGAKHSYYDFSSMDEKNFLDPELLRKMRIKAVVDHLGIDESKIRFIDHHTCHAHFAYYCSPFREDTLILTADAIGDGLSATVSIARNNKIERIFSTNNFQFARVYRYITLLLGMKPFEHEYKVMGLAPYSNSKELERAYHVFAELMKVDGLEFTWNKKPKDLYFHFREALEGCRFDGIAGALQKVLEELFAEWVGNAIKKTGINTVVIGGGIAMNIKLNLAISKMPEVKKFFVGPSPADESNSMGACYATMDEYCKNEGLNKDIIAPLDHAYLGNDFTEEDIIKAIEPAKHKYEIKRGVNHSDIARFLVQGKTIGICRGRMEFGARALGNRSIIANPSDHSTVKNINNQIKFRDFWMPFTPSILAERADDYLINPKSIGSPFMTIGFETTELARKELIAALHPADLTARPQIVTRATNQEYHDLISEFEKLTGIGAVLNTSLNLHGSPIVCTPKDAVEVMDNSKLDMMYFGNTLVCRK